MTKEKVLKILKWTGISLAGFFLLISILLYSFRGKIINYVVGEVNQHLVAKVQVQKIDLTFWKTFPRVSVDFNKVLIYDTIQATNDTVLYSDLIRLKFDALKLWNKKYVLEEAQIYPGVTKLVEYDDGRENYLFFKTNSDSTETSSAIDFQLKSIKFSDFRASYENKITRQSYSTRLDKLHFTGDFKAKKFDLKTRTKLKILAIKNQGVQLLSNKDASIDLQLLIDKEKDEIIIPKSQIEIEKLPFEIEANIGKGHTKIVINGKDLQLNDVVNHFFSDDETILKYKGEGLTTFNLTITDDNQKETPTVIDCHFNVANGKLVEPTQNISLSNINLEGEYSNKKGIGKEYVLLKNVSLNSNTGPFSGKFLMTNFARPHYQGNANGAINLQAFSSIFRIEQVELLTGWMQTQLQFDVSTAGNYFHINSLSGNVQLENTTAKIKNDSRNYQQINGEIAFNKNEAYVKDLSVKLGTSDLTLNGELKNIERFISQEESLFADIELTSTSIDIKDLENTEEATKTVTTERSYQLPENIQANLTVQAQTLKYEKHIFKNLSSNLRVSPNRLDFTDMHVENADINMKGSLTITETAPEYLVATAHLYSPKIDFKKLLKEWNNFEQEVILENNIEGFAAIDLNFKAPFDLRKGIIKEDIFANIQLKIVDGALKNVEMFHTIMKDLKKSSAKLVLNKKQLDLFEQRLSNLQFDVLENQISIISGKVTIPEMDIKSSALDLTLSGWHTFKNEIDYRFSFRFRDLKTVKRETEFGYIEDDGTGFHIFMKMTGMLDNPQIAWDKDASKAQKKEIREKEKESIRSMLKSEFGIGKKDGTIEDYRQEVRKEVQVEVDFGVQTEEKPVVEEKSKLQQTIDKKVQEAKKQKQQEVEFDLDF